MKVLVCQPSFHLSAVVCLNLPACNETGGAELLAALPPSSCSSERRGKQLTVYQLFILITCRSEGQAANTPGHSQTKYEGSVKKSKTKK